MELWQDRPTLIGWGVENAVLLIFVPPHVHIRTASGNLRALHLRVPTLISYRKEVNTISNKNSLADWDVASNVEQSPRSGCGQSRLIITSGHRRTMWIASIALARRLQV